MFALFLWKNSRSSCRNTESQSTPTVMKERKQLIRIQLIRLLSFLLESFTQRLETLTGFILTKRRCNTSISSLASLLLCSARNNSRLMSSAKKIIPSTKVCFSTSSNFLTLMMSHKHRTTFFLLTCSSSQPSMEGLLHF